MKLTPFKSMEELGEVYAKDLEDGWYHSRFGFNVLVEHGSVYKIKPDGSRFEIHPNDYSIFIRGKLT